MVDADLSSRFALHSESFFNPETMPRTLERIATRADCVRAEFWLAALFGGLADPACVKRDDHARLP
jgi:hypothetical protein